MGRTALTIALTALLSLTACGEPSERSLALREVAELGTLEVRFSKIIASVKNKRKAFLWFRTGSSRAWNVETSNAVVTLGINIDRLAADDVKVTGDRISLLLPPVEIIHFNYDPSRFEREERLSGVVASGNVSDNEAAFNVGEIEQTYRDAERQVRQQLPYEKLRRMAERRTALFFTEYLKKSGFREVFVTFREGDLTSFREGDAE